MPFNRPARVGRELDYVKNALDVGHVSGNGLYTKRCQDLLREKIGSSGVLLTTSCTSALEMSGLLLGIEPGDEVLVPSFSFPSTASAFALRGARPVFVDIRSDTLNVDPLSIEERITEKTKALVLVHYAGVGCDMDEILAICRRNELALVEDNAHGLFGSYRGQKLGSMGDLATLSFHETKNFVCGEGGAIVLNRPDWIERAEILWEKGTNRSKFFRGEIDKYTWVDLGSSYLLSDFLAAFLLGQLEERGLIQARRREIWGRYDRALAKWARNQGVRQPVVPVDREQTYHIYYLVLPDTKSRDRLLAYLKEMGVHAVFHYLPLHSSPMGIRLGGADQPCPVSETVSSCLVRLPLFHDLSDEEVAYVIEAVESFRCS